MKLLRFTILSTAVLLAFTVFPFSTTAAQLNGKAEDQFQTNKSLSNAKGYRAFAVDQNGRIWGQNVHVSWPRIAIHRAIEQCQTAADSCWLYAIGNMIVDSLPIWQAEVAEILYQIKRNTSNQDLAQVNADDTKIVSACGAYSNIVRSGSVRPPRSDGRHASRSVRG